MFNSTILQLSTNPYHMGALEDADSIGQQGMPGAGPFMTVYLRFEDETICEAWFETYGCPSAIASGSWLMRWVEGKKFDAVKVIEPNDLNIILGGLPLGKEHCAQLAIQALRGAIDRKSSAKE